MGGGERSNFSINRMLVWLLLKCVIMPSWFSDVDRRSLVRLVQRSVGVMPCRCTVSSGGVYENVACAVVCLIVGVMLARCTD